MFNAYRKTDDPATAIPVKEGDTITSFKGEAWQFINVSRGGTRIHAKRKGTAWTQEFFPSVFNLVIREE